MVPGIRRREGTHYGWLNDSGDVQARCGAVFPPLKDLFSKNKAVVAVVPMQAGQSCPTCRDELEVTQEKVEQPPPNNGRRFHPPLGALVKRNPGATTWPPSPTPPQLPPAAPVEQPPPAPTSPDPQGADGKPAKPTTHWYRSSTKPGATHWVIEVYRGTKHPICGGEPFQGKKAKKPTPEQLCPTCNRAANPPKT